jgi:hypothetical protein
MNAAYQAAHEALSGRYNGDIGDTAERIAWHLTDDKHPRPLPRLVQSYDARRTLVDQLVALDLDAGVHGGADHARPLLDNAVALAARALLATQTAAVRG